MYEQDRREIGGALTDEERERSQEILRVNFPYGIRTVLPTPDDAKRRREQLLKFFKGETDLAEQVVREEEVPVVVLPRALRESTVVYKAPKKKGGLIFRAVITAVHLYQSLNKRLAK